MLKFSGWSCLISDASKVCVTKHWQLTLHCLSSQWVHIVSNVTAALSATIEQVEAARRAQSAFELGKRRASLALWSGWWGKETLKQACRLESQPAPVAFKNLMTHGSAIRIAYRTSLRSSSLWEPRYPSLRIWFLVLSLVRLLCYLDFIDAAKHKAYFRELVQLLQLKAKLRWLD